MDVKLKQKPSGRVIEFTFEHARRLLTKSSVNNFITWELADDKYIFQGTTLILKPVKKIENDTNTGAVSKVSGNAKKSGEAGKGSKTRTKAKPAQ